VFAVTVRPKLPAHDRAAFGIKAHFNDDVFAYKKLRMAKSKKNKNEPKLNLTVREEQRHKLEQMASLEKRSVSNLIEVMADERWERLVEQQGIAYAKTVAEAMKLKLDMNNPADREKLRRAVLDLVAGMESARRGFELKLRPLSRRSHTTPDTLCKATP
jgi:uncharacterized protein (DUF1778 family)